jgi:hypothetical protein
MQIHILITFLISAMLEESRATALDLDTASRFLLNVFDICTSVPNNLSTKIKALNWFKINGDLLLRPFTLLFE